MLLVTWHMAALPARVVIINQSGTPLGNVVIDTAENRYEVGSLGNGESRRITIEPAQHLRLTFSDSADRVWSAPEPVTAGQSLVLYITPGGHVLQRNRIGTLAR